MGVLGVPVASPGANLGVLGSFLEDFEISLAPLGLSLWYLGCLWLPFDRLVLPHGSFSETIGN